MRVTFVLINVLFNIMFLFSQKVSLQLSYEPALYLAENHIDDYIVFLNRNEYKVGVLIKSKHLLGISYENSYGYTNNPKIDVDTYSKQAGYGIYYRYISNELKKIENVRVYAGFGLFYRNSNEIEPIIITDDYRFAHIRVSTGFEYNFWKYFYLNIGVRPVYFFENTFQWAPKFLIEMRYPIIPE